MTNKEIYKTIDEILTILENNFKYKYGKKIPYNDIFEMIKDLYILFQNFENRTKECGQLIIKRYIPLLDLMIKVDGDASHLEEYEKILKYSYKVGARVSLEHYMVYREWNEPEKEKFFEPRYNILSGYIHYLQEIEVNPNFHTLIFNAPSGYGKLIANYIPVLTRNGWKNHGNLVVGDEVLSPSGEFIKVTMVHPKRYANVRVTFEDGEQIDCHNQHEWQVFDRLARKEKQVETNYLIEHLKEKNGRNRFLLPLREMVKGEHKQLPVDPYTYGVWLGDGSTNQGRITQNINDLEIFNYIPYEITSSNKGVSGNVNTYHLSGLANDLHKLELCYQKHKEEKCIHESYLTASIEQRLELLAGIIDTDGYLDKEKQRYIIVTCGKKLKNDIVSLLYTFGWRVSVTEQEPTISTSGIDGKQVTYYIGFNPTIKIPCKLPRKQLNKVHKQRRIGITNIELINPTEGNCITVEGGLYLVGKTLKITHNTYPEKISEAWAYGIDDKGTTLALCSNDEVVKGGSRTVIDEIKSEHFGEVFPHLKYDKEDKEFFLKETDGNWKLRNCKMLASYYASTTNSNVVGERASKRIHIDDLYPDYKEALNQELNKYYLNKSMTVWEKRFVQNKTPKVVITGTLWASGDYIDLKIQQLKKENKFIPHPKYPYTLISEDGSVAIIQVPALDYETDESTCPEIKSTYELKKERNRMEEYLWETNFQQRPTNPGALIFSYDKIRTYETIPTTETYSCYASIDCNRKSGKDYFSMPIFKRVENDNNYDYYLVDCIFTNKVATKDLYSDIVDKMLQYNIKSLVIEQNASSELKGAIENEFKLRNIPLLCEIMEKWNAKATKSARIQDEMGLIKRLLVFPKRDTFGENTEMGNFMINLTTYNHEGSNTHDDAPDSCALFCSEIIEENSQPQVATPLFGIREFM